MSESKEITLKQRIQEIESDGRINLSVPEKLESPHILINGFFEKHEKIKKYGYTRNYDPTINIAVSEKCLDRAFRIYDTFIKACEARGHEFYIKNEETIVKIYEEEFELRFWEKSKITYKKDSKWQYDSREYEPTGNLFIQLIRWGSSVKKEWGDTPYVKLEDKLARVIANLEIKSIEETKDRKVREKQEQERKAREELEAQLRKQKEEDINQFRTLMLESERWQKAKEIREYLNFIEQNKENFRSKYENLEDWLNWAKKRVDWYDPSVNFKYELLGFFNDSHREKLEGKEQKNYNSYYRNW